MDFYLHCIFLKQLTHILRIFLLLGLHSLNNLIIIQLKLKFDHLPEINFEFYIFRMINFAQSLMQFEEQFVLINIF